MSKFKDLYRLRELESIDIDSWVEAISRLSEFDKVRKEAYEMAGRVENAEVDCPAELEKEYTELADKYDFRFDREGRIAEFNITKGE